MELKSIIKTKLSQYLSKEISREILCQCVKEMLHKALKESAFEIKYLEIWGIITGLLEIEDIDDLCCEKLVSDFNEILLGDRCASFSIAVKIPPKFIVNNLSQTKQILQKYMTEKHLTREEIVELELVTQKVPNAICTLNDMLELQIIDLLKSSYDFYAYDENIVFGLKSTLFINEDMALSLENELLKKIMTLLDCYSGQKCFWVHINFNDGIGNISVQV